VLAVQAPLPAPLTLSHVCVRAVRACACSCSLPQDRDIGVLSGGELQRFAISVVAVQKAVRDRSRACTGATPPAQSLARLCVCAALRVLACFDASERRLSGVCGRV
jgi:hypothetical protein